MDGYHANIEKLTLTNSNFRKVLYTGKYAQLVVMSLAPGEEIGLEVHENVDQFFRFEQGTGNFNRRWEEFGVQEDDVAIVPAGSKHNIINTSQSESLKLYTIYSPPNHPDGTIHKTKEEAVTAEKEHN